MDEASRCDRIGFMREGRMLVEGAPAVLRQMLTDRILELRGQPLGLLRQTASAAANVEAVQMFGDRIHLRVRPGMSAEVISRLEQEIPNQGGEVTQLRLVPPQLEDVFISLLEN
jgi:ABC-type multidrug transport system ATPase subunit